MNLLLTRQQFQGNAVHGVLQLPSLSGEGPGVRLVTDMVLKYLYRDKIVEVIQHDSIPYPVEVPIEVEKPIPRFYVNCTIGFWLLIIGIIIFIAKRLYLYR